MLEWESKLCGPEAAWKHVFLVCPPKQDQDCDFVWWKCFDMLPNAKKCFANVYASIFRHVDKVVLLESSVSCFYCLFAMKWNFCKKYGYGRPRLVAVARSLKCFGNDLISWWLVSVKAQQNVCQVYHFSLQLETPSSICLLQKQTAFKFLPKTTRQQRISLQRNHPVPKVLQTIKVLSVIAFVSSQILCQPTAKMTCWLKSPTLADWQIRNCQNC